MRGNERPRTRLTRQGKGMRWVVSSSGLSRGSRDDVSRNPARRIAPRLPVIVIDPAPGRLDEAVRGPSGEERLEVAKRVKGPRLEGIGSQQYVRPGSAEVLRANRAQRVRRCGGAERGDVPALEGPGGVRGLDGPEIIRAHRTAERCELSAVGRNHKKGSIRLLPYVHDSVDCIERPVAKDPAILVVDHLERDAEHLGGSGRGRARVEERKIARTVRVGHRSHQHHCSRYDSNGHEREQTTFKHVLPRGAELNRTYKKDRTGVSWKAYMGGKGKGRSGGTAVPRF